MDVKPFKTYEEQLAILKERGLVITNEEQFLYFLKNNNYYRISGYTLPHRSSDSFFVGFSDLKLYEIMQFDKKLRNILFKYIEIIEIRLRTQIAYEFSKKYDPIGYKAIGNFDSNALETKNGKTKHELVLSEFESVLVKNNDLVYRHHREKYDGKIPLWVAVEYMSYGILTKLFNMIENEVKNEIIKYFYPYEEYKGNVYSHFVHIGELRNKCAHADRLYSKRFNNPLPSRGKVVNIIKKQHGGRSAIESISKTCFGCFISFKELFTNDKETFKNLINDFKNLVNDYPNIDISKYGFPTWWEIILNSD